LLYNDSSSIEDMQTEMVFGLVNHENTPSY